MKKPKPLPLKNTKFYIELGSDEKKGEHFGEYLIRKKLINEEILEYALAIQKRTGDLLGEILQEEGFIPPDLFQEYSINRLFNPHRSQNLAEILLKLGKINKKEVEEFMLRHKQSGRALGAILLDEGIISPDDFSQKKIIEIFKLINER